MCIADKLKDYEELAAVLMSVVDRLVHKTKEKIESATDVLKAILKPVIDEEEEISWPPRDPDALVLMQKELNQREQEGQLDEGFLAEVNAQLRQQVTVANVQAKEDGDKPGLEAMLQKVLQLYASRVLSKRSYARKGNEVLKPEQFLETLIQGALSFTKVSPVVASLPQSSPETEWNKLLLSGLTIAKGDILPQDLYAVVKKRIERVLIRTVSIPLEFLASFGSTAHHNLPVTGGWIVPAACPHRVPKGHPIKGRGNCECTPRWDEVSFFFSGETPHFC
ncbi:hypothetical protein SASPL_118099 [Salvia splendens]|uniref:Uncharacterized protein n=1 Tax=Salvia splendens TaxID=180675 RepID=A0A8X8ZYE2_SALSN|nr:hypothetical protein SASPL_118099 [Salvia splendens]